MTQAEVVNAAALQRRRHWVDEVVKLSGDFGQDTMRLETRVLTERGDAADVEAVSSNFSFVADAKAFRLSRTARNQKDFKVQAMDRWKHGTPYA